MLCFQAKQDKGVKSLKVGLVSILNLYMKSHLNSVSLKQCINQLEFNTNPSSYLWLAVYLVAMNLGLVAVSIVSLHSLL